MSKIILRVSGGMGNQIFSYAAARRLSIITDSELVIDNVSGFLYDYKYTRQYQLDKFNIPCRKATAKERLEPFSLVRRYIKRKWNRFFRFEKRDYIIQEGVDFDSRLLNISVKKDLYLEGYWQSEKYFSDIENVIRKELTIRPPSDSVNLQLSSQINNCTSVAIHIRFFDHPTDSSSCNNVSEGYYNNAIEKMEELVCNAHFFVFSDNSDFSKSLVSLPDSRVTFVTHNQGDDAAYADLWLMTLCQNFIIANSTFSWWGAWLSCKKKKNVITPSLKITDKKRITSWGFDGLLPDEWIQL